MDRLDKKIVIFDDDEDILSICIYILEEQGWEVQAFTNCNDIVERITAIMPDVILMDNWIPDDGGIIATQKLKKEEKEFLKPPKVITAKEKMYILLRKT